MRQVCGIAVKTAYILMISGSTYIVLPRFNRIRTLVGVNNILLNSNNICI